MGKFYLTKRNAEKHRMKGQRVFKAKQRSGRVVFKVRRR